MVNLSSFCQYPTVKVINKDTLVLMTLKQGQDINQKFVDLTNTIKNLSDSISSKKNTIDSLNLDKKNLNVSLSTATIKTIDLEKENEDLKKTIIKKDQYLSDERKKWAGWMFFSFMVTVMLGALK